MKQFSGQTVAMLSLIACSMALVIMSNRAWATAVVVAPGLVDTDVVATGRAAHPAATAMWLLLGVAGLALRAVPPRLRFLVGLFAAATAVVSAVRIVLVPVSADTPPSFEREPIVGSLPGVQSVWELTMMPWFSVGVLVVMAAVGLFIVVKGHTWPAMSSRYDAPAGAIRRDDEDPWSALDHGEDPTR